MIARISSAPGYKAERKYVLEFFFKELLGFDVEFREAPPGAPHRAIVEGRELVWPDEFFGKAAGRDTYLDAALLPRAVGYVRAGETGPEAPAFFGEPRVALDDGRATFGYDLPAMIFFGLSRWEEALPGERDAHGRFPPSASFAFRTGILERPWIDEQAELVASILRFMGVPARRPDRFRIVPTHDVDKAHGYEWKPIAGDLLKRGDLRRAFRKATHNLFKRTNPYDTFDFLMDESERAGLVSRFYFMGEGRSKHDGLYRVSDAMVRDAVRRIESRGHVIGYHPGYRTFRDAGEWRSEKSRLERGIGKTMVEGRQHFLMFDPLKTWRIQEEGGMLLDSTMGYAARPGFRCGTGSEFPCFDLSARKPLRLRERPLIVMDGTLAEHLGMRPEEGYETLARFRDVCAKYGMPFTILFHNASFDEIEWPGWKEAYSALFSSAGGGR